MLYFSLLHFLSKVLTEINIVKEQKCSCYAKPDDKEFPLFCLFALSKALNQEKKEDSIKHKS